MSKEVWKHIKGYAEYVVSNKGIVRTIEKYDSIGRHRKDKPLKIYTRKTGYSQVVLQKNKNIKAFYVHRLVAQAFIPNPNNYRCINHKDMNPSNNHIDNLEWCTYSHNLKHAFQNGRITPNKGKIRIVENGKRRFVKNKIVSFEKETNNAY